MTTNASTGATSDCRLAGLLDVGPRQGDEAGLRAEIVNAPDALADAVSRARVVFG